MHDAVIIDAIRTPVGRHGGALAGVRPDDLAAIPLQALIQRSGIDPALVEEVFLGCANQAGEDNRDVARMALLLAGLPQQVAGVTFNRLCASGLNAINQAARAIKAGEGEIYIAGGVESMSRSPYSMAKAERAYPTGHATIYDTTLGWRYPNPRLEAMFPLEQMGETAENIYELSVQGGVAGGPITREQQDAFALRSQRRAVEAMRSGRLAQEITPAPLPQRKGPPAMVDTDEHPRFRRTAEGEIVLDTTLEQLAGLRPIFRKGGTVTAGNSSGLNDGAAALLLTSAERAAALGLKPLARVVASAAAGVDPRTMGLGPIPATRKVLQRAGLRMADIGLIEINEAFAVQALACMAELEMDPALTNVNGGAIALGHPLGCSGARLLTTLVHEMQQRAAAGQPVRYGLVTLCVGVGQGEATVVEWLG
ncbi:MAG TPA: acetyl-CoA C-acyltransferase [Anaerolineae bacterium]|nr:acetyl-CoA C-acyltransferase [Anaerolineae bacterium]HNU03606.1 acetyl-CoA C-acyltransferase [Anaerolineae bacterium]